MLCVGGPISMTDISQEGRLRLRRLLTYLPPSFLQTYHKFFFGFFHDDFFLAIEDGKVICVTVLDSQDLNALIVKVSLGAASRNLLLHMSQGDIQ